jgi:hypothetical protein
METRLIPLIDLLDALFITPAEELYEVFLSINKTYQLETAEGEQLEWIGRLIGVRRDLRNDEELRQAIKAQSIINTSEGLMKELQDALNTYTGSSTEYLETYPLHLDLYANGSVEYLTKLKDFVEAALPAHIRVGNVLPLVFGAFGFEGSEDSEGFGSVSDPTVGGPFSGITI